MNTKPSLSMKRVLIVTSSGGGGLLQAANAKEQEILSQYPSAVVMQRDVMKDWIWKWIGRGCVLIYNSAQRRGSVAIQRACAWAAPASDLIFWPFVFVYAVKTLFQNEVDRVLDTQVLGTSALIKAIRIYNKFSGKNIFLEKILVDMPTPQATHFFAPIKKLSSADRDYIRLVTIPPILDKGETEVSFWKRHCDLDSKSIQYEDYYVRQTFRKFKGRKRDAVTVIPIAYKSQEELTLLLNSVQRGSSHYRIQSNSIEFTLDAAQKVVAILLGSQPAEQSSLRYVRNWIEWAKLNRNVAISLFVFCANHRPFTTSLLQKVSQLVSEIVDYPSQLTVIPVSFQNEQVIAPLFHRCDITCTRSGGQTAMEVMCVGTGNIWIHSEALRKEAPLTNRDLLAGIPGWESANAAYMQQAVGAKIVTPETFCEFATASLLN